MLGEHINCVYSSREHHAGVSHLPGTLKYMKCQQYVMNMKLYKITK